jgi:hypothetical protein
MGVRRCIVAWICDKRRTQFSLSFGSPESALHELGLSDYHNKRPSIYGVALGRNVNLIDPA